MKNGPHILRYLNTWSSAGASVWGILWNLLEEWGLVESPGHWQWASRSYSLVLLAAVLMSDQRCDSYALFLLDVTPSCAVTDSALLET